MASRRLLSGESQLRLHQPGLRNPSRRFCSPAAAAAQKPAPKKAEAARERKAQAVASFVQRYMATNGGMFPKIKHVHDAIGGSWYNLKIVLSEVKANIFREPQADNKVESAAVANKEERAIFTCSEEITEKNEFNCTSKEAVLTTTVDLQELTKKLDTASAKPVKKSDDEELSNHIEQSTLVFQSSAADGQPMADLLCHGAGQVETTALEQTPTKSGQCKNILFQEAVKSADSNFLKLVRSLNLTQDFQVTGAGNSALASHLKNGAEKEEHGTNSEEKVGSLLDWYKNNSGKEKQLNVTKLSSFKHGTLGDKDDNGNPFASLSSLFKTNTDNKKLEEKDREDFQSRSGVQGFLDQIVERERVKNGSLANERWNKRNAEMSKINEAISNLRWSVDGESSVSNNASKSKENAFGLNIDVKSVSSTNLSDFKLASENRGADFAVLDYGNPSNSQHPSEGSDSNVASFDYEKPSTSQDLLFALRQNVSALPYEERRSSKHELLLKFVPKDAKVNDIYEVYGTCGMIVDIQIVSMKGENRFNYARVAFKTRSALRTALSRTDVAICGVDVVAEHTSHEELRNEMENVKKIDYPTYFLANPSHAVLIERLPNNLSFSQLESALLGYGSLVGLAMGSSTSSIYAEFKDQESKEKALAGATISVQGKKLPVFRVEPPKTTVVRISRVNPTTGAERIHRICNIYGSVQRVLSRDADTFDVQFKLSEWPNMLSVLNSLNGLVIDEKQWVAQPATVVPADVLNAMWNEPEGRKHVVDLFRDLCSKIDECSVGSSLSGLLQKYCQNC